MTFSTVTWNEVLAHRKKLLRATKQRIAAHDFTRPDYDVINLHFWQQFKTQLTLRYKGKHAYELPVTFPRALTSKCTSYHYEHSGSLNTKPVH
jgi:hypothetical protein